MRSYLVAVDGHLNCGHRNIIDKLDLDKSGSAVQVGVNFLNDALVPLRDAEVLVRLEHVNQVVLLKRLSPLLLLVAEVR